MTKFVDYCRRSEYKSRKNGSKREICWNSSTPFFCPFFCNSMIIAFFLKLHCGYEHKTFFGNLKMLQVEVVRRKISFFDGLEIYRVLPNVLGNITGPLFLRNRFMVYDIK